MDMDVCWLVCRMLAKDPSLRTSPHAITRLVGEARVWGAGMHLGCTYSPDILAPTRARTLTALGRAPLGAMH